MSTQWVGWGLRTQRLPYVLAFVQMPQTTVALIPEQETHCSIAEALHRPLFYKMQAK